MKKTIIALSVATLFSASAMAVDFSDQNLFEKIETYNTTQSQKKTLRDAVEVAKQTALNAKKSVENTPTASNQNALEHFKNEFNIKRELARSYEADNAEILSFDIAEESLFTTDSEFEKEVSDRTTSDQTLAQAIAGEQKSRTTMDKILSGKIVTNENAITKETTDRETSDQTLAQAIASENNDRSTMDKILSGKIVTNENAITKTNDRITKAAVRANVDLKKSEIYFNEALTKETADRETSDQTLAQAIAGEQKSRTTMDKIHTTNIQSNADAIKSETDARITQDNVFNEKFVSVNKVISTKVSKQTRIADLQRQDRVDVRQDQKILINRNNIEINTKDIKSNRLAIADNSAKITDNEKRITGLEKDFTNLSNDYYDFKEQTNGAIAGVAAMGQLAQPYGVGKVNVGVGVGAYENQQAVAIGMGYRYSEQTTFRGAVAANTGNDMNPVIAASVNYEW